MTQHVRPALVRQLCEGPLTPGRACRLVDALGPLAPWWLRDEVLRLYGEENPANAVPIPYRPKLASSPGACWIIYENDPPGVWRYLAPAFLLPLEWRSGAAHGEGLPRPVRELAVEVSEALGQPGWGLHLGEWAGLAGVNLEDVDFPPASGWVALAGGLLNARTGRPVNPEVWATGRWGRFGGIDEVDGLRAKWELARSWGVREFFVPAGQGASLPTADPCQVREFGRGVDAPQRLMRTYLAHLEVPPPVPTTAEECEQACDYYRRQPPGEEATRSFYRTHLLGWIRQQQAAQIRGEHPTCQPRRLVTVVSQSPELAVLLPVALGVEHCLLLHTPGNGAVAQACQRELRGCKIESDPAEFPNDLSMRAALATHVEEFIGQEPPEKVAFDLTPGTKLMTYTLSRLARKDNWLVNLTVRYLDGRPNPGTERTECWQAEV